jgi:hypothetical protein
MGIRDEEISRLVKYAEGLGLKVTFKRHKRGDPGATWITDGSEIEVFTWPQQSKTEIILNLIHELAHHTAWVYAMREKDEKTDSALRADDESTRDNPAPRDQRRLVYLAEKKDARYRSKIIHEVGIRLPKFKISADKALDIWIYKYYYRTGNYPTLKTCRVKKSELREKYRRKFDRKDKI